ncbi:MFS transporter [Rhodococcus sp. X156]|uniref:MFS transporter n=1 Tax=Rhodococcus sp. X156 TaxID=2499145 RepID=UPI000FD998EA|nr:MFS transporter [Rhodococcus sp. X156]
MTSTLGRGTDLPDPVEAGTGDYRRISLALFLAGVATFGLLYDTQAVLPQLGADLALSPTQASLSVSVATGALALAVLPLATLSEAVGRRRTMLLALGVAAVVGVLLPLAPSFGTLLGMRAVQGVALAGLPATAMAYLGEEMSARALGGAMGLYIAGNSIGGMTGRLVSGLVADVSTWRVGLAANAAVAVVCTVAIVVLLPASRRFRPQPLRLRPLLGGVGAALADPALRWMYAVAALLMGTFVGVYNYLGFRLTDEPFDVAPALVALLFLAYAVGSLTAPLAGRMTVRLGRPAVLAGWIVVTLLGVLLMLVAALPAVLVGLVLMTGGFFAAHATASGWVAARAQGRARAQASGLYLCAYYAGSSVGGWAVGVPFTDHGWTALTVVVLGFLVLALACVGAAARLVRPRPVRDWAGAP